MTTTDSDHALALTFQTVLPYERAHQAVLRVLLDRTPLSEALLGRLTTGTQWEPVRGLFDLAVSHTDGTTYVELKVDSPLSAGQLRRQSDHVRGENVAGQTSGMLYVLLGLTAFEHDDRTVQDSVGTDARAVGALALADAVEKAADAAGVPANVAGMGKGYARALRAGHAASRAELADPSHHAHAYLVYEAVRGIAGIDSRVYSASNPSGPVRILNDSAWHDVGEGGRLYQEFNGGRLALKVDAEAVPPDARVGLRAAVRKVARATLDRDLPGVEAVDGGRTGAYMTALYVGGPATLDGAAEAAALFRAVHDALPEVARVVRLDRGDAPDAGATTSDEG